MTRAIIFLDVDGVLNSLRSCVALGGYKPEQLDPVAVRLLDFLCAELIKSGVKPEIVISSTWRKTHKELDWWNTVVFAGCPNVRVVGMTPSLPGERGHEVAAWLAANAPGTMFVCLDDDSDFLPGQPLVVVNGVGGLHVHDIDEAHRMITGKYIFPEGLGEAGKWRQLRMLKALAA